MKKREIKIIAVYHSVYHVLVIFLALIIRKKILFVLLEKRTFDHLHI